MLRLLAPLPIRSASNQLADDDSHDNNDDSRNHNISYRPVKPSLIAARTCMGLPCVRFPRYDQRQELTVSAPPSGAGPQVLSLLNLSDMPG